MSLLRVIFLSLIILFSGCTSSSAPQPAAKPILDQLVHNPASMTKTLKALDNNLNVQILKTGVQGPNYVRIVALKLSDTPVLAAISQTKLNNKTFVNIIANADITPIGTQLFAANSPIKRNNNMHIRQIKISNIHNPVINKYLLSLGYVNDDTIIERSSQFYYHKQTLDLIEYILPTINQFL